MRLSKLLSLYEAPHVKQVIANDLKKRIHHFRFLFYDEQFISKAFLPTCNI